MEIRRVYMSIFPDTTIYSYLTSERSTRDISLLSDPPSKRLNSVLNLLFNKALHFGNKYNLSVQQIEASLQLVKCVFIDNKNNYFPTESKENSFSRFSEKFSILSPHNQIFTELLTDFIANIYQHFYLYQWVIENERGLDLTEEELMIETPQGACNGGLTLCELSSGTLQNEFKALQKRQDLDQSYKAKFDDVDLKLKDFDSRDILPDFSTLIPSESIGKEGIEIIAENISDSLKGSLTEKLVCEFDSKCLRLEYSIDLLTLDIDNMK